MTNLKTADGRILKEIGQIARRNSKGEFIDKQAVYIIVSEKDVNPKTQMLPQEEKTLNDIAQIFAEKFAKYVNECKAQGLDVGI